MSYLLDALNKSGGNNNQQPTPQPVMYQQTGFAADEGVNVYKWISITLALVLTLLVGIVLGNKYSLLSMASNSEVQPTTQVAPVVVKTPAQKPVETKVITPEPKANVEVAQKATETTTQKEAPVIEEEPIFVSSEPRKPKPVKALNDSGLDNIPSDLLAKFNKAIKDSENVGADYGQPEQDDVEAYFTKVPKVTELNTQQQLQVPTLVYETHLYSSDEQQRRVKINGKTLTENQWVNEDIQVLEIQRQFLILQMGHIRFSLPALTDWQAIGE